MVQRSDDGLEEASWRILTRGQKNAARLDAVPRRSFNSSTPDKSPRLALAHPRRPGQHVGLVGLLPTEPAVALRRTTEMPVAGGALVDRLEQLQVVDDP